jgi:hypothetical protein
MYSSNVTRRALGAAAMALFFATAAFAQTPPTRIRGQIEKVDGSMVTVKARDGSMMDVKLADNARIMAFVKASPADIKPNSYVGVTAMPEADGTQKAVAVHIFLEGQRGTGEGFRQWDLRPNSTMTNANVESKVASVDGDVVMVKYKDGEKKVIVSKETPVVAYTPGEMSEVKPGAQIIIFAAQKQADGTYTAPAINVGRGVTPPM